LDEIHLNLLQTHDYNLINKNLHEFDGGVLQRLSTGVPRRVEYRSQLLSHGRGLPTPSNLGNSILCEVFTPSTASSSPRWCRPTCCRCSFRGIGATEPVPVPVPDGSGVSYIDVPLADPGTCCLRQTPKAVCWALTSGRLPVTACTSSSRRSSHWTTSSMANDFPELDPVVGGMVEEPELADTRMSRARALER
jgi:hypothetical protein